MAKNSSQLIWELVLNPQSKEFMICGLGEGLKKRTTDNCQRAKLRRRSGTRQARAKYAEEESGPHQG